MGREQEVHRSFRLALALASAVGACTAAMGWDPPPGGAGTKAGPAASAGDLWAVRDPNLLHRFLRAGRLLTARLAEVKPGPAAKSDPPIWSMTFALEDVKMLRGAPLESNTANYSVRSAAAPRWAKGANVVLGVRVVQGRQNVVDMVEATADNLAAAHAAAALPMGWTVEEGKPVSPWGLLGAPAWPKDAKAVARFFCSRTGRPALPAGPDVRLEVRQVIPPRVDRRNNPYGDGKFTVTVTNTGARWATEVPALLMDGNTVLWAHSLVILDDRGQAHLLPSAGPIRHYRPARLEPGQSIEGEINTLTLKDVSWPRGASRVFFTFCLGELSATNFFYYSSRVHGRWVPPVQNSKPAIR